MVKPFMIQRCLAFIGGMSAWGLGYRVYTEGGFRSSKYQMYISYEGMRTPIALLMFCIGIISLYSSVRIKSDMPEEYICTECEEVEIFPHDKNKTYHCPQCGGEMEVLFGFYDRHLEKKDLDK
ncbi:MAG: hypothetical protein Q3M24_09765 [Candidatus Electrothrix aestuarii]|uniref:Uncharacterized protein n=1 Tax=Candidatus Electrothrix aestuarii TaxID=3062594 RepID=A0AAU8LZI4_9BACT|nr:hypothetical protein [Candidatus Electrothrix aestuarii]